MLEEKTVTGMADMMNFPKRWEDFLHDYEFEDARRIYTNGSRLIPSFRVKQMMEHYAPVRHGRWIEPQRLYYGAKQYECSLCYSDIFWKKHSITEKYPQCPNCGCRMGGGDDE